MITHTHSLSLVLASILVSMVASITALAMMKDLREVPEAKRKAVVVMSAFVLGGGIWSMHFVAMLSLRFSVAIHYDLFQTLSSGLIAVLVVGFALLLLHFRPRTKVVLNTAGLALGVGIVAMHFVGMLGMRGVIPEFSSVAILAALIVALVTGVSAVRVSYGSRTRLNIVKGGIVFGLSVVVVHFTAMLGTQFSVDPDYNQLTIALDQGTLAILVTVAVFVICGSFLLAASTFVPTVSSDSHNLSQDPDRVGDRAQNVTHSINRSMPDQSTSAETAADGGVFQAALHSPDPTHPDSTHPGPPHPDSIHRGTPGQREKNSPAANSSSAQTTDASRINELVADSEDRFIHFPPVKIPFEEHKQISFVPSDEVGTIRAYGRYTQLYTKSGVKFCPWSITEAEKRLSSVRFYRSHRSYLINIAAIAGFEKNRDAGICRFEGFAQLGNVPVSRARVGDLVAELGL